jgi:hypothetical protein
MIERGIKRIRKEGIGMPRISLGVLMLVCGAGALGLAAVGEDERILGRGDSNNDSLVNVSDVIFLNNFLFSGGPAPPCMNQADTNLDGRVDNSDSIYLLNWLYNGGPAPPSPGPYNKTCFLNAPTPTMHSCQSACY